MTRKEFGSLLGAANTMLSAPFETFDIGKHGIKTGIFVNENTYKAMEPLLAASAKYEYKIGEVVISAKGGLSGGSIAIKGGRIILLPDEYTHYALCVEIFRIMEGIASSYARISYQDIYQDT